MSLQDLPALAEGLFLASDEECLTVFVGIARATVREIGGAQRSEAADRLHNLAVMRGLTELVGEDAVQEEIAKVFDESGVNDQVPDAWPDDLGRGNGQQRGPPPPLPRIVSSSAFMAGFIAPDYLIDGMLQRRFIYALTGQTGHAKTAVALLVARLISCDDPNSVLGKHRVGKGRVIYFVGENPDDVRMRLIGANAKRADAPENDNLWFISGVFDIESMFATLVEDIRQRGEFSLIIIDTSAAYFLGDEELSNTQMGNYARMLRKLTALPGGPCVLVLCHPIKHVIEPSQLLPRGGGAYLNEMDGNLTLWRKPDDTVELHYNKMRGPGFAPMSFKLEPIITSKLIDTKGREIPTVQAIAIDQVEEEQRADRAEIEEDRVLATMLGDPDGSLATWAMQLGWYSETGEPYKMKVGRILDRMAKVRPAPVRKARKRWALTEDGKAEAREAAVRFAREDAAREARTAQAAMAL